MSAAEAEGLASCVPLARSEKVTVILALPEGLPLAVAEAESGAVAPALGLETRVALCVAEETALALLRAVLDTAPARVKLVEALGRAPLGVLVEEGVLVLRGDTLVLREALGEAVDVTLLEGLGVVLAVAHSVEELLPVPLAVAVGVSVGVALPVPQAVAVRVRLEVKEGLPLAVATGDAVPTTTLRELLGVREDSCEGDAEAVTLGLKLARLGEGEEVHTSTAPPCVLGQRVALPLLEALMRALREAETEPVCVALALPLRVAEPLPLAVPQGSGDTLAVGDTLPTPEPASVPVLAGLPLGELLKVAVGAALAEARLESVALCVAVCVAHVLPLRVGSELALGELEDEAQDVAEALCVECMELLRDGVLPCDSVSENKALCVSAEGELLTEPLPLAKKLGDSVCVEHGEAVGEAVVEWLSLGAREELPEGLSAGVCEAQTLALGDTLLPRLLLGQGEADAEELLM